MTTLYFEDISVGDTREGGSYTVTKEEIIEFAEQYDPLVFHTDEERSRDSIFGELIASGWHTAAINMRLLAENYIHETAVQGAIGVDEIRWPNPVYPGDTLTQKLEIVEKDDWSDRLGLVSIRATVTTTDGRVVLTQTGLPLIEKRDANDVS